MIYAERGNKVITIKEESIQKYVDQGYMITDEFGNVIKNTIPVDVPNLKKAYSEHIKEIETLKAQIEELVRQNAELKEAAKHIATTAVTQDASEKPQRKKKSTEA